MIFVTIVWVLLLYIVYTRFYKLYSRVYFYYKQGIAIKGWILPVLGNAHSIIAFEK